VLYKEKVMSKRTESNTLTVAGLEPDTPALCVVSTFGEDFPIHFSIANDVQYGEDVAASTAKGLVTIMRFLTAPSNEDLCATLEVAIDVLKQAMCLYRKEDRPPDFMDDLPF
jgi:hypothetical protein